MHYVVDVIAGALMACVAYILTFNPGWDSNAQKVAEFTDVRELQRRLKSQRGAVPGAGR